MIEIRRATETDHEAIVQTGKLSVAEAHRDSCSPEDLDAYIERNYNPDAIKKELADAQNIYHIITRNGKPAGFSKIIFNAIHPAITRENVTKLDRIYLYQEYFGMKLGYELLQFNIELAKKNNQSGIWLYTWVGNSRAVNFYSKAGFTIIGSHHFYVTDTRYNLNHHLFLDFLS